MRRSLVALALASALASNVDARVVTIIKTITTDVDVATLETRDLAASSTTTSLSESMSERPWSTTTAPTGDGDACSTVSSMFAASSSWVPPSIAVRCLESVPLDIERSLAFIDWVTPFLQIQSSSAYLAHPPDTYVMDGVDIFGGLSQIADKIRTGSYPGQYAFEKDLFILVNVLSRDFHLNLPMPLLDVFTFSVEFPLASVSIDGALPQVFSTNDLKQMYNGSDLLDWTPSAIVSINGQIPEDYLLDAAQDTDTQYADPDAIFNRVFSTIFSGGDFVSAIHNFGFTQDQTTFVFANGSTISIDNKASSYYFADVDSGSALFSKADLPKPTTAGAETPEATPEAISEFAGFPKPLSISPDGKAAAYILSDPLVGVLSFSAMTDDNGAQTKVITDFLDACASAGCKKLIVDLQGNGGGQVPAGMTAFQQLFPGTIPLLAQRYRDTPMGQYLGKVWTTTSLLDSSNVDSAHMFDALSGIDENGDVFKNYTEFTSPQTIWGDNFTAITRRHYTPITPLRTERIFASEDIVMLFDGSCGSTCTLFAQAMKSQGGVRSIAVGGRPQTGPMQGVAGSKGAWVLKYGDLKNEISSLSHAEDVFKANGLEFPSIEDVPFQYRIVNQDPPLGASLDEYARVNIPSTFNSTDPAETPLQFTYEAANCRLFYQPEDIFDGTKIWERVVDIAWGSGKCVSGSSINTDDTISSGAYDTLPLSPIAYSKVPMDAGLPGFVPNSRAS